MGWFRRGRRSGGPIPWWQAELARRQMDVIQERVELELIRKRLELRGVVGPSEFEAVRQLELHLSALRDARKDMDHIPSKRKRWRDRLVIRLWEWSTKGKFDPPAEVVEEPDPFAVS